MVLTRLELLVLGWFWASSVVAQSHTAVAVYDLVELDRAAEQAYVAIHQAAPESIPSMSQQEFVAGFRTSFVTAMQNQYSDAGLAAIREYVTTRNELPEDFSSWIRHQLPRSLYWYADDVEVDEHEGTIIVLDGRPYRVPDAP